MKHGPKTGESRFRRQQRSLARLIERLKANRTPDGERKEAQYRKIIRRSVEAIESSEGKPGGLADCEKWLDQTSLEKHHLRAITAILHDAEITSAFLNGNPPLSLKEALEKIRQKAATPATADGQRPVVEAQRPGPNNLLTTLCSELLQRRPPAKAFPLKCGIYELAFTKRPKGVIFNTPPPVSNPETPKPVELPQIKEINLELPPDIAEALGKAGRFCGLTRAEVVAELVSRQDPARLVDALSGPEIWHEHDEYQ
jgi:hypothetical protein